MSHRGREGRPTGVGALRTDRGEKDHEGREKGEGGVGSSASPRQPLADLAGQAVRWPVEALSESGLPAIDEGP
jgi:hypothetical protein